jgi:hypothetical protein
VVGGDAVAVVDTSTRAQQQRMDIPAVMAAALSPLGTYLITFQRPTKTEGGAGVGKRLRRVRVHRRAFSRGGSSSLCPHTLAAGHCALRRAIAHIFWATDWFPLPATCTAADRNLKVWRLADGQCLLSLHQKVFIKDAWPTVQFNAGACGGGGGGAT